MEVDPIRIQDDLRGVVDGDVLCDPLHVQLYASDASIYEMRPVGVVRPRTAADVVACVRYAAENGLSVHARGAGSGLAGESLGRGLIIDFSRYMRRLVHLGEDTVRVQPGLVLAELNRELAQVGRLYGPDPATRSVTTMGSVLALDASGSHWPRYGSARGTVVSLQAVTADGELVEFGGQHEGEGRFSRVVADIATRHADALAGYRCRAKLNRGGYRLDLATRGGSVDLPRLLVGSEGTLALITEATVRTESIPACRGVAMLFFDRLEQAARGAIEASALGIAACDLLDRRLLEIARETDARYERLLPRRAEAMLLVELAGDSTTELRERLRGLVAKLRDEQRLAFEARQTTDPAERDFYWRLCRRVIPRLYRLRGSTRPLPFVEDVAVDPADLPEFLVELQNLLKSEQVTASVFAHAGHGQLHLRPFLDLSDPEDNRRMRRLADRLYDVVLRYEGTTSGEHGAGLSRSWILPRQYGALWPAMIEIKQAFDPENRLNPGKVVGADGWQPQNYLRPVTAAVTVVPAGEDEVPRTPGALAGDAETPAAPELPVLLDWTSDGGIDQAARMCNGCARCRTTAGQQRMCPMFRIMPREEAAPRAKANLMRGVLAGRLNPEALVGSDAREIADLCFHCHQCRLECPASVDIPKLVSELKGQHVATNGLQVSDWWPTRLDLIVPLLARLGPLRRWVLESRRWRWILQWAVGLAAARQLPRIHHRSFLRWAARRRLNRPIRQAGRKVVFFVDHFVNWHDHQLGRALVEVMRHNQIGVYIPGGQSQSWMAKIAAGDLKGARRGAKKNVRLLAEAVRQGYQIVCTEPTAALCLKREYLHLLGDDEDARLVAENTHEACRYLWDLHHRNELALDFHPVSASIAYHQPCHVRAIDSGRPATKLLGLIPGITVRAVEQGCSGMAGTFGLKRENYRNSLRIGWGLISAMRSEEVQAASTECSACRMQIEHGSGRSTLHPIKLLAYAYGRLPELADSLPPQG